jgi:mono/diheme cytochrome c family protein
MPFVTRKSLFTLTLLATAVAVVTGLFVWSGVYNIGADDTHTKPVYALLQTLREQSINHHAGGLKVPDLADPALIRRGAGNYDAMCTGCHLAPGLPETELSKGLYPSPPNLTKARMTDAAHHFWVIKHGIKASGMPAWGKSMEDEYIWGMVAFLQQLPKLDEDQYKAMVASSGGHSHGGGETAGHHHAEGTAAHDDGETAHHHNEGGGVGHHDDGMRAEPEGMTHTHADGTKHVHAAPKAAIQPAATTPVKPAATDDHATMPMPEPAPQEHAEHDHQH